MNALCKHFGGFILGLMIAVAGSTLAWAQSLPNITFYNGYDFPIQLGVSQSNDRDVQWVTVLQPGFEVSYAAKAGTQWLAIGPDRILLQRYQVTASAQQNADFLPPARAPLASPSAAPAAQQSGFNGVTRVQGTSPAQQTALFMTETFQQAGGGSFIDRGNGRWVYRWPNGAEASFVQVERSPQHVKIHDSGRNVWHILTRDKFYTNTTDGKTWDAGQAGSWLASQATTAAPPVLASMPPNIQNTAFMTTEFSAAGGGSFIDRGNGRWVYRWPNGAEASFVQVERTPQHVKIHDSGRNVWHVLTRDKFYTNTTDGKTWDPGQAGRWVEARHASTPRPVPASGVAATANTLSRQALLSDPDYQAWLRVDAVRTIKQPQNQPHNALGRHEEFRAGGTIEQGFNIFKIKGDIISDRDLTERVNIFDTSLPFEGKEYTTWSSTYVLPFMLDFVHIGYTSAKRREEVRFSNEERRQSKSMSVSLGAEAAKGSAEVGYSSSEERTNLNERGMVSVHQERWGVWGQVNVDKRYITLSPDFINRVMQLPENDQQAFERFFEGVGTHYAIRAQLGGKAALENLTRSSKLLETFQKSVSANASVKVPIKAASVTAGFSTKKEAFESSGSENSDTITNSYLYGGELGRDLEEWGLDLERPSGMKILKADLRPISDLIRPQLFNVTDAAQVARINRLRSQMVQAYNVYRARILASRGAQENWQPRVFRVRINHIKCLDAYDREAFRDANPDVFGTGGVYGNGEPLGGNIINIRQDDQINMAKGSTLPLNTSHYTWILAPNPKRGSDGKLRPSFENNSLDVSVWLKEDDGIGGITKIPEMNIRLNLGNTPRGTFRKGVSSRATGQANGAGKFEVSITVTEWDLVVHNDVQAYPDWRPF